MSHQEPKDHALYLDRAHIAGKLIANRGFTASGAVTAVGVHIQGLCDFRTAKLFSCGEDTYALNLDGAEIATQVLAQRVEAYGLIRLFAMNGGSDWSTRLAD